MKMGADTTHIRMGHTGNSSSMYGATYVPGLHFVLGAQMMKNRMNSLTLRMVYLRCHRQKMWKTDGFQPPHVRYTPREQIGPGSNR